MENTFSARGLFKEAYKIIKPQFWNVVGKFFGIFILFMFLSLLAGNNLLLSFIVSILFGLARINFGLAYVNDNSFVFENMFGKASLRTAAYFFMASLISGLAIFAGILLLIVPGIIFALKFSQVPYLVVDKSMKPMEALRESSRLTKNKRGRIFLFWILALGVNILGALALIVGLFFTIPLTLIATTLLYKKLIDHPVQEKHDPIGESVIVDTDAFSSSDLA